VALPTIFGPSAGSFPPEAAARPRSVQQTFPLQSLIDKPNTSELFNELIDTVGQDAAVALARQFGGVALSVPKTVPLLHPITQTVGPEAAKRLAWRYGGERLNIPQERTTLRRLDAISLRQMGYSLAAIAERLGVNMRTARRYVRGIAVNPRAHHDGNWRNQPRRPQGMRDSPLCPACGQPHRRVIRRIRSLIPPQSLRRITGSPRQG